MSGQAGGRGYLVQAIVSVLGALEDDHDWVSVTVEPNVAMDKVDILWQYSNGSKVVQVKSSQNPIHSPDVKRWAEELENSISASEYELCLIGNISEEVSKRREHGNVKIPLPQALNPRALLRQAAHLLHRYMDSKGLTAPSALILELMVEGLVTRFSSFAAVGKKFDRTEFDNLLSEWISVIIEDIPEAHYIVRKGLPLVLPSVKWDPDWMPPGALLRADLGVVRFHQRKQELEELTEWCCSSSALKVQLCHGAGGMGKTRLAIELCRQMREKENWQAGFLDTDAFREDNELWQVVLTNRRPLLLVLDYAESCSGILCWVFSQVTAIRGVHVRILLLTRKAGDWLEQLKSVAPARELLTGPAFSQRRLGSVTVDPSERQRSWQIAHEDLAKALEIPPNGRPPADLSEKHFERILLMQMSALAALENVEVKGEDGLLDYVLNRERDFWKRRLRAQGMSEGFATGLGQTLAGVTLNMGAETEADGLKVLSALPFFRGQPQQVLHDLNRILADSYPGNHWIEPVQPDLLGERLFEVSLDDPELREILFGLFRSPQDQQGGEDVSC